MGRHEEEEDGSFNSRARKGRDIRDDHHRRNQHVSIHAPARGATTYYSDENTSKKFQFTRPQGARPPLPTAARSQYSFNSRARKGRDQGRARAQGRSRSFNSRARKGRDTRNAGQSLNH